MVLAITFLVMLLLYWLISKRILYNIPIGEKIFLFQNEYAHLGSQKVQTIISSILFNISIAKNIFINNALIISL